MAKFFGERDMLNGNIMFPNTKSGPADQFNYNYSTQNFWFKLLALPVALVLRILFRMKVEGLENVPFNSNFIIMPNHVSHLDSFFTISLLHHAKPFHFIADEKLFKNKYFRMIASMLNVFPVRKGARSTKIVNYAIARVNAGSNLLWYPEGQRHKNPIENKCNPGKLGSGMIAHATDVPIIPVFVYGPEFCMPVGKKIGIGKRLHYLNVLVRFGKPVPLDDLRKLESSKETSKKVVDRIIEKIEEMRPKNYYDQSSKI